MVRFDWYKEKLDRIQVSLNSRNGAYAWVIGDRGTGKSEVLSHLFCRQIKMADSKNPRLPLYISVSEEARRLEVPAGVKEGKVTIALINHLCSRALKETFEFLRQYEGNPELYKDLRKLLRRADFYDGIIPLLMQEDFELGHMLEQFRTGRRTKDAFRIVVYVDDMDKIDPSSARDFFVKTQTDLSELVSEEQVVFLSSVTKEFIRDGRDDEGLNYCLGRQHLGKESEQRELTVPDLGDLPAVDVQDLINERLTYLHWGKPETPISAPWVADFNIEPHESLNTVLNDPRWKSYDTRNMRRNGSLLCLNAWLAARKQVSIRQVLRNLQAVLNDCDKPGAELTAAVLEQKLKTNDSSDKTAVGEEIRKRIKGVKTERLRKEHAMLSLYSKTGERTRILWNDLLYVTMERISLGEWGVPIGMPEMRSGEIKKLTNQSFKKNSAIFQFLNLIVDLSSENSMESLLPNVHSRFPDDVFSVINAEVLKSVIMSEVLDRKTTEFEEDAGKVDYSKQEEHDSSVQSSLPGIVGDAYHHVIGNQFDKSDYGDPRRAEALGKEIALELVRGIILSGRKRNWGGKGGLHRQIKKLHEDEWRQFRRSLLQWVALRSNSGGVEVRVLRNLRKVLYGRDPFALQELELAQAFDTIVNKGEALSVLEIDVEQVESACNSEFPEGYSVNTHISGVKKVKCMKKNPVHVLQADLKVKEKIVFTIVDKNSQLNFKNLGDSLTVFRTHMYDLGKAREKEIFKPEQEDDKVSRETCLRGLDYDETRALTLKISTRKESFGFEIYNNGRMSSHGGEIGGIRSIILDETSLNKGEWGVKGRLYHTMDVFSSLRIEFRMGPPGSKSGGTLKVEKLDEDEKNVDSELWFNPP